MSFDEAILEADRRTLLHKMKCYVLADDCGDYFTILQRTIKLYNQKIYYESSVDMKIDNND